MPKFKSININTSDLIRIKHSCINQVIQQSNINNISVKV